MISPCIPEFPAKGARLEGGDIVAPSDMMDGRFGAVRTEPEASGFRDTMILADAAKYASGFHGPSGFPLLWTDRFSTLILFSNPASGRGSR